MQKQNRPLTGKRARKEEIRNETEIKKPNCSVLLFLIIAVI
jgi:hypothetical protein